MKKVSFYDWCIKNGRQDLIDMWDVQLNKEDIRDVPVRNNNKYYFKIEKICPAYYTSCLKY